MPASSVSSALNSTTSTTSGVSSDGMSGLSGTDFMNILIKQLQMQDPMKPMTNQEMVAQLSTIRELEMNTKMSNKLEQLTDQQRFGSAAALIGRQVKGTVEDDGGTEYNLEGLVTGVRFTEKGECMLELDSGAVLPIAALQQVTGIDDTVNPVTGKLVNPSTAKPVVARIDLTTTTN